jgi:hypothetical protein
MLATFDGPNKIVILNDGVTAADVKEIYSEWKNWAISGDNTKYEDAFRSVGGDPLPGSKALGATYFMRNGWKIRPYEGDHTLTINGNLYCEDGSSPFVKTVGNFNVFVISAVSSLVDATIQQLPEIEHGMYQNQVTIDVINGVPGSAYPIGTPQNPVNNLADAKAIAVLRGLLKLYIIGPFTVQAGESISGYTLLGTGPENTFTSLASGCTTAKTDFQNMSVSGRQNGETHYHSCDIGELSNVHCQFERCRLIGPMHMHPNAADTTVLYECYTGDIAGAEFVLDMNNSPVHMSFNAFYGKMRIINMNKATAGIITINMGAGKITIDASCTTGTIKIRGTGEVIDESTGTIVDNDVTVSLLTAAISGMSSSGSTGLTTEEHAQLMGLNNVDIAALIDGIWNKTLPNGVTVQDYITYKLLTTNKFIGLS